MKRTHFQYDFLQFCVAFRYIKQHGDRDEASECFRLFDKRDKQQINAGDIKQVLSNYLEFPVSENDIRDFVAECGGNPDGTGVIDQKGFINLYLS